MEDAGRQNGKSDNQPPKDAPAFARPILSLPKGGGAIRGIGEKFAANPVTGTGSLTVPIATSPGRSGFGPQLSLSYDSGAGNGPYGLGWSLALPAITRKTDKGLPRYRDAEESDVFLLSGAEDLVPVLTPAGDRFEDRTTFSGFVIHRYRPRIEGLFARIERWTDAATGEIHWRSITRDNVTTLYGKENDARIFDPHDPDPAHPTRIFCWLICQSYDDKGNAIVYKYSAEDDRDIDRTKAHERNRVRTANRYVKRILYGNRTPNRDNRWKPIDPAALPAEGWMFEIVFDYGEHDQAVPLSEGAGVWPRRNDPFSTYRAGFEVRTYRLCQRVLMFHHFPAAPEVGRDCLVRSTDFTYAHEPIPEASADPLFSKLVSVTQSGYKRKSSGGYVARSLPPLEFTYSDAVFQDEVREVDAASLENLPAGLASADSQWVDLDGEGLSGILTEQGTGWFYKRNLSPIGRVRKNGKEVTEASFAPVELIATMPSSSGRRFLDLAGDGQVDLVTLQGPTPGFFERTPDEGWESFKQFRSVPNIDWNDPNLRFVDLTGDGHADVLVTEDEAFCWYPSLAEDGFGPAERVRQSWDDEKGPRLLFADGEHAIHLADLSGDGLSDLVRIRNGEVCYWPNLGYGRFGAKVIMDRSPWFDPPEQFDPQRIQLADIDGSGVTDIVYLGSRGITLYFNQSGNSWSDPRHLDVFPQVDNVAHVRALDLLGNGTACLVWSSPLPGHGRRCMRFLDLMGGIKPHLLVKLVNNLGAERHVQYAPSTKFYLQDKRDGTPWITRLPFPVHVVERIETLDAISRNRFVTRYSYHSGYFDGEEREFRGFGRVDQLDTEEFATLTAEGELPAPANLDARSHVPPVLTRSWFHTGAYLGRDRISHLFAGLLDGEGPGEYYREPGLEDEKARTLLLSDTVLPDGFAIQEEREACRALKGSMLRQEVFSLDDTGNFGHPYIVTEQSFTVRGLQRRGPNRHAVFFTHPRESVTYQYERNPADPRVQHALTLDVDDFGNVLESAVIGYGRRRDAPDPALLPQDRDNQRLVHITYTETRFTHGIDDVVKYPDDYRAPLLAETGTFEVRKAVQERSPNGLTVLFRFGDVLSHVRQASDGTTHEVPYEDVVFDRALQAVANDPAEGEKYFRRCIERARTRYRRDDLTALLPLGELEPLALPGESYKLALTSGLVQQVYRRNGQALLPNAAEVLGGREADGGGYVDLDSNGHWWIPSGRVFYSPTTNDPPASEAAFARAHFFLPHRYRDPFHDDAVGAETMVAYDDPRLLVIETRDALDNRLRATYDYRVLAARSMTDPNGNRSEAAFDALGLVVATAVRGKASEDLGDLLEDFDPDPPLTALDAFVGDPRGEVASLLGKATTRFAYDLQRFARSGEPPFVATLARETHFFDPGGPQTRIQVSFSYSDGFGREIQRKIQAEPGPVPLRDASGKIVLGADGQPEMTAEPVSPRWVGSGWVVFNNKGKAVRRYEPFFSDRHRFEFDVKIGVSPILFYDPIGRVVATLHPNHTYEKVVFDPWRLTTYDVNDTVAPNAPETGDPRTDRDVKGYMTEYFKTQPGDWRTWREQRISNQMGAAERIAAEKAAAHANTPTVAHFDALGRPFLTLADNGPDPEHPGEHRLFATRVQLDAEDNPRKVRDAMVQAGDPLGRLVEHYDFDMLGTRIRRASMEAGERWVLTDVAGKPIRLWDSRGFMRRITYDELRRPLELRVTENGTERLAKRIVYGEGLGDADNHRTRVHRVFDGAGVVTSEKYDFKGNLLRSKRELLTGYEGSVNWLQDPELQGGSFITSTTYDALHRPVTVTSPDSSVYHPTFNDANLLDTVEVELRGAMATSFVTRIQYNAKGQRESIVYGNGTRTSYQYDPLTFRLTGLKTTRLPGANGLASQLFADPEIVQDLRYTLDPIGNVTRVEDRALKRLNQAGPPDHAPSEYSYDATYRLIEASGREHLGQTSIDFGPANDNPHDRDYPFFGLRAHPNDIQAMRRYAERYEYDGSGNIERLLHIAEGGNWTRGYEYDAVSLLEATKRSNRLTKTTLGDFSETYSYTDASGSDVHGCMTSIDSMAMVWDFEDQLQRVDLGGGGAAHYVYDGSGQRVRKVIETQSGMRKEERIYLGPLEVYREYSGNGSDVELERETLHVTDGERRIAVVETKIIDGQVSIPEPQPLFRYQYGNHLGSASLELDQGGGLISYEEYHPYGTSSFQAMASAVEVSLKRYRYTGKERDEESGLYYHGARYYAAWLGRWVSCDPSGIRSGVNLYAYGANQPTRYVDLDGRDPDDPSKKKETPSAGSDATSQGTNKQAAEGKKEENKEDKKDKGAGEEKKEFSAYLFGPTQSAGEEPNRKVFEAMVTGAIGKGKLTEAQLTALWRAVSDTNAKGFAITAKKSADEKDWSVTVGFIYKIFKRDQDHKDPEAVTKTGVDVALYVQPIATYSVKDGKSQYTMAFSATGAVSSDLGKGVTLDINAVVSGGTSTDLSDDKTKLAPSGSFGLNTAVTFKPGGGWQVQVAGGVTWTSGYQTRPGSTTSSTRLDAGIGVGKQGFLGAPFAGVFVGISNEAVKPPFTPPSNAEKTTTGTVNFVVGFW